MEFLGGPKIPYFFGRKDDADGAKCPANGRLPDANQGAEHLRKVFGRMGFNDQEIVALSGAHTLGRCHLVRSGFDGPWTQNPLTFDNQYFKNLMNLEWQQKKWDGPIQYEDVETQSLMMLPTDMALRDDSDFQIHVKRYAEDQNVFFTDFAAAFGKLLALGATESKPPNDTAVADKDRASTDFREYAMHGSLDMVKRLAPKADVHALENGSKRSALHKAAFWGHLDMVTYLLEEHKLDVNAEDYNGDTPLHDATRFGNLDVVKQLLAHGASLSIVNKQGQTALGTAQEYGKQDIIQALEDVGAADDNKDKPIESAPSLVATAVTSKNMQETTGSLPKYISSPTTIADGVGAAVHPMSENLAKEAKAAEARADHMLSNGLYSDAAIHANKAADLYRRAALMENGRGDSNAAHLNELNASLASSKATRATVMSTTSKPFKQGMASSSGAIHNIPSATSLPYRPNTTSAGAMNFSAAVASPSAVVKTSQSLASTESRHSPPVVPAPQMLGGTLLIGSAAAVMREASFHTAEARQREAAASRAAMLGNETLASVEYINASQEYQRAAELSSAVGDSSGAAYSAAAAELSSSKSVRSGIKAISPIATAVAGMTPMVHSTMTSATAPKSPLSPSPVRSSFQPEPSLIALSPALPSSSPLGPALPALGEIPAISYSSSPSSLNVVPTSSSADSALLYSSNVAAAIAAQQAGVSPTSY